MTPPEAAAASDGFELLTELLASEELWLERAEEAEGLVKRIVESPSPIVVLLGPPCAGKTELLRRWIIPYLSRTFTVSQRDACESPESLDRGAEIEIWDSFERCLTDERIASGDLVTELTHLMQLRRKVMLIVGDESLSRLFQLSGAVPQLRGEILQISLVSGERVAQTLRQLAIRYGLRLEESFIVALALDLNGMPATAAIGMELAAILLFQVRQSAASNRDLGKDDYIAAGGLNGILESYLDFLFERVPEGVDPQIAWAVVQRVVATVDRAPLDLDEVARRFDVPKEAPWRVVRWLEVERRVLRPSHRGGYSLVPPQMVTAVENRMRREALAVEHIRTALQQGVRSFTVSEALLSPSNFKRAHSQRTAVKVTDEEAKLMLRCALAHEDVQLSGATDYWLQRIGDEAVRIEVLFDALFDVEARVRQRAVKRLAGVNQPEIRNQVHLLALRDPSPEVRAEAVGALDAIKDHSLRRSLLQEINEPNSPYRLHAIEALRVFAESEVTEALVDITRRNRPGEDTAARLKAIEILGVQNTDQAADALLDIALADKDAEDRAGAAGALSAITDEELLARILERLRRQRSDATKFRPSFPARALVLAPAYTLLCLLAVIPNFLVHGVLLGLIGRWRLALAILGTELAGLVLLFSEQASIVGLASWLVPVLWLASLLLGTMIPLRILLLERLDSTPQSEFRRYLCGVLFALCSATLFLYFHGLPSILVRRVRRGLVVFGFEALGLLFVMSALYFEAELTGFASGLSSWFFGSFRVAAALVLVVSYITGVGLVLLEAFVLQARRTALEHIDEVCSRLLQSPAVSARVFRNLTSESRQDARWSKELVNRFGERMQEPLRRQWPGAEPATKQRIFAFLVKRRDASVVQFVQSVAPSLGWTARLRAFWAGLAFRFSVWPRPFLVALTLIVYALVSISAGIVETLSSRPERLIRVVRSQVPWYELFGGSVPVQERQEAVGKLRLAAQQTRNHELALAAATQLAGALTLVDLPDPVWKGILEALVQVALSIDRDLAVTAETQLTIALVSERVPDAMKSDILEAIVQVARASERPQNLVDNVDKLLGRNDTQTQAIDALRRIGGPYASLKLARFTSDRIEFVLGRRIAARTSDARRDEAVVAAKRALEALRGIEECGDETVRVMTALGTRLSANAPGKQDRVLTSLVGEVLNTVKNLDPLSRAEYYLTEQDFTTAIAEVSRFQGHIGESRRRRAQEILSRAYTSRGMRAAANGDVKAARTDLNAAIDTGAAASVASEVVNLGLGLAFQYHEVYAPRDPQAYDVVHDILSKLEGVADSPESRVSVRENLTESSLTTGNYDQAIVLAEGLLAEPRKLPAMVNMKYMLFAALAMKGDRSRADVALADLDSVVNTLPKDFENNWSYAGTKRYIERVAQGATKQLLLKTLTRISSGS